MQDQSASSPETLGRVARLLAEFEPGWALCGGWAADAWLGRETRDHADVDIAVFENDQVALFQFMDSGWTLIGHDDSVADDSEAPWQGRQLFLPAHIHARRQGQPELEFHLNEQRNGLWVFSHQPEVTMPVQECIGLSSWGLPAVVPEVILYYKALPPGWRGMRPSLRPHDHTDFKLLRALLRASQREWIRHAISQVDPGHSWLKELR